MCLIIDNGGTSYTVDNTLLGQENISVYKLSYTQEPKLLFKLCRDWWEEIFQLEIIIPIIV